MKVTPQIRARWAGWRLGLAFAATLAACGSAHGFYWYDWPGSRIRREPSLLEPRQQNNPANPPSTPRVTPPTPPPTKAPPDGSDDGPPPDDNPPPVGPEQTPEPATGLIGLAGLGAVAARVWLRKR